MPQRSISLKLSGSISHAITVILSQLTSGTQLNVVNIGRLKLHAT